MASDLGLHCLPMPHKKDARLIWVKLCLISCDSKCYVALPHSAVDKLQCVIVVFSDHTHFLYVIIRYPLSDMRRVSSTFASNDNAT